MWYKDNLTLNWEVQEAEAIDGEKPCERFRYSSAVTQVGVLVAERIDNMLWSDLFEKHVWGKVRSKCIYFECSNNTVPEILRKACLESTDKRKDILA